MSDVTNGSRGEVKEVPIIVNNKEYKIKSGPELVSYIKQLAGISAADVLEELVQGKLELLRDDATLEIKAGDRFVSHPRTSSSSSQEEV